MRLQKHKRQLQKHEASSEATDKKKNYYDFNENGPILFYFLIEYNNCDFKDYSAGELIRSYLDESPHSTNFSKNSVYICVSIPDLYQSLWRGEINRNIWVSKN